MLKWFIFYEKRGCHSHILETICCWDYLCLIPTMPVTSATEDYIIAYVVTYFFSYFGIVMYLNAKYYAKCFENCVELLQIFNNLNVFIVKVN